MPPKQQSFLKQLIAVLLLLCYKNMNQYVDFCEIATQYDWIYPSRR